MGPAAMILIFWMLSFKTAFSFSSFAFIKGLLSYCWRSARKLVSSAYLRLLIYVPAVFIPACASSILTFFKMHLAYKLNKQGGNMQHWHTLFPIWNKSVVPYPVLTVASSSAHRCLRRQVQWNDIPISWRIFPLFGNPHSQRLWDSE